MKKDLFSWLSGKERKLFERLNSPSKIQNFLNTLPFNFEKNGETLMSPKRALRAKTIHCIEGALLSSSVLWYHGKRPLLMHFKTTDPDIDHVVSLFKKNGYWGAISKTNHSVLRYRDPIYKTPRELALSYFNEYYLESNGKKTMVGYSKPIDLEKKFGLGWLSSPKDLWNINNFLYYSAKEPVAPQKNMKNLRLADKIERDICRFVEWKTPKNKKRGYPYKY